jgi:uncharacterized protein (TIGR00369 family)
MVGAWREAMACVVALVAVPHILYAMATTRVDAGGDRRGSFWDVIDGRREPPPAAVMLGWEVEGVDQQAGTIELSFTAREEFLNLAGNVQGGFLAAMLDATLGPALATTLSDGEWAPTINLNVQFVRPAKAGKLRGRGRVVRRGRDIAFLAGELIDGEDIIATASASAIIRHS